MSRASEQVATAAVAGGAVAAVARATGTDTHGRWPWLAAVAAPPATAALRANRARVGAGASGAIWVSVPLLLWHQTEEWVLPGGFLPWFNHSVWGSSRDDFPLTPRIAFRVNVIAGWGVSVLGGLMVRRVPALASGVLASHVANAALHVGRAIEERRYNPGLVTALALGPLGVIGVGATINDRQARAQGLLGAGIGLAVAAALPLSLRRRMRS